MVEDHDSRKQAIDILKKIAMVIVLIIGAFLVYTLYWILTSKPER